MTDPKHTDPTPESQPRLYGELASWWPLLSAPEDYAEEALFYRRLLEEASVHPLREVLELGSGGGNNASHLKAHWKLTLVDRSPAMLAVSRALNPECEHREGDMRTVRLGQAFDAVFIHDAATYLLSAEAVRAATATAFAHCRPGGAVLFCPDETRESFEPYSKEGGHDGEGRSLRYLEWVWDPDPSDDTIVGDFAYMLREGEQVRVVHDRHVCGMLPRATWLEALRHAGFEAEARPFEHSEIPPGSKEVFLGRRPAG
jgi:SAM-dependent methyltransferase